MAGIDVDEVIENLVRLSKEADTLSEQVPREQDSEYYAGKHVAYEIAISYLRRLKG